MTKNRYLISNLLFCVVILGCSTLLYMKPEGNLNKDVIFPFLNSSEHNNAQKVQLYSLYVQEQIEGIKWDTIWEVSGKSSKIKTVKYGVAPKGMTITISPRKFNKNKKYRICVKASIGYSPPGHLTKYFFFQESGDLVTEK